MRTTSLLIGIAILATAMTASAGPTVNVGNRLLLANTPGQIVQVWVTGDGNLAGLNLFAQVGDGGPELALYGLPPGVDGPAIAGVNLAPLGGLFAGTGTQTDLPGIPQVASSFFDVTTGTVNANGLLLTLSIDTSGFTGGSWALMLRGVLPFASLGGPYDTAGVGPGGATVPFTITNGSVLIASETHWITATGNWSDSNCWSAGEPDANRRANISNGGTSTINQLGEAAGILTMGSGPRDWGAVNMGRGTLNCGTVYVGMNGGEAFTQTGGTHTISDLLTIGRSADSNGTYTLSGGELVVRSATIWARGSLILAGGGLRGSPADANLRVDVYSDGFLRVTAGNKYALGDVLGQDGGPSTGIVQVDAEAALSVRQIRQDVLGIGVAGRVALRGGSRTTSVVNGLKIAGAADAWTGQLDIKGNYLIVGKGDLATIENQVKSGMNLASGYWDGNGIMSSLAAADTNFYTAVGMLDNSLAGFTSFGDVTGLTGSEVLLRYTFYGDADLSGTVDFDNDYILWQTGFLNGLSGWVFGDFNYDGVVDFDNDYILWQTLFLNQPPLPGGAEGVPEPASLSLLSLGALALLRRRA